MVGTSGCKAAGSCDPATVEGSCAIRESSATCTTTSVTARRASTRRLTSPLAGCSRMCTPGDHMRLIMVQSPLTCRLAVSAAVELDLTSTTFGARDPPFTGATPET
jgi:hypothetical protein